VLDGGGQLQKHRTSPADYIVEILFLFFNFHCYYKGDIHRATRNHVSLLITQLYVGRGSIWLVPRGNHLRSSKPLRYSPLRPATHAVIVGRHYRSPKLRKATDGSCGADLIPCGSGRIALLYPYNTRQGRS